jgi:hypothetical protein
MSKPLATYSSEGLEAVEMYQGIYRIENLLQPEDIQYLRTLAESTDQDGWKKQNYKVLYEQAVYVYGEADTESIAQYIERNTSAYWDDKLLEIPDKDFCLKINKRLEPFFGDMYDLMSLEEIQRQYEGVGLGEHVDSEYDKRLEFAVVIYINDDFTGGELYFPTKGIEIKPIAGSCVLFDTGSDFLHGVRKVGPGPGRYAMAGFAWTPGVKGEWLKDH